MLSGYRYMWMMVMFDLPVAKASERKTATKFRNFLEKQGFSMCQFSVYARFCGQRERTEKIYNAIEANIPEKGHIKIIMFTDKQFGNIVTLENRKKQKSAENPEQYLLFEDIES
jgi:CRISPR-associated protein Cas2